MFVAFDATWMTVSRRAIPAGHHAVLYRRHPGTAGPQQCLLILDLATGSFSVGHGEQRGGQLPGTARAEDLFAGSRVRDPALCWPIPCLTAEGANQVLEVLAPLARNILAGTSRDDHSQGFVLNDAGAVAAIQVTRLCDDIGLIVDLLNEVVEEHDAAGWFAEEDVAAEYGITARTTDGELRILAGQLERGWACPNARPVAVVLGVTEYLAGCRAGLRSPAPQ